MNYVYKESMKFTMKIVQEQWLQLKMKVLFELTWKLLFSGGNEPMVGERVYWGGTFPGGGNEQIFG